MRCRLFLTLLMLLPTLLHAQTKAQRIKALKSITPREIKQHVYYLADDQLRGRESGKPGAHSAATYIAEQFRLSGLRPMGKNGSYFQPFIYDKQPNNTCRRGSLADSNLIWVQPDLRKLKFDTFRFDKDFKPLAVSGAGYAEGRLVFAGYGLRVEAKGYDDYAKLKVKGRVVLVLDGSPWPEDPRTLQEKIDSAKKLGAAALIVAGKTSERKLPRLKAIAWPPTAPPSL